MMNRAATLINAALNPDEERDHPFLRWFLLGILFLGGLWAWGYFLNFGNLFFHFHDWAEINIPRLAFLKDAVTQLRFPLHMPDSSALRNVTDRFMALPDVILSPQVILMRWLSIGDFVLVNTWLLFTFGFWGLLQLKKRLNLSLLAFSWLFILFNFNGHIIAHYAVGHITWGGYFLFPWFVLLILDLIQGERGWQWAAKCAFLLFAIFLQGSFHQFVWCLCFLGWMAIAHWKYFLPILRAGVSACLLSAFRMIPPALQVNSFDDDFLGGYRSLRQLIRALVRILPPSLALDRQATGGNLGWWEYDLYFGGVGALFLIVLGVRWLASRKKETGFPAILLPLGAITLWSIGNIYGLFRHIPIPLFQAERVSARFLIVPAVFLMVLAVFSLQDFLRENRFHPMIAVAPTVLLFFVMAELWSHLSTWQIRNTVEAFPYTFTDTAIKTVANHPDAPYTQAILAGAVITALTAIGLIFLSIREKRRA